jgi:hypothetical protein
MVKKWIFALLLLLVILFSSGCFNVQIEEDVDFPAGRFAAAREKVAVLASHNPERAGRAGKMQVLVYDGPSREMVQVAVPMWLVGMAEKHEGKNSRRQPQDVARHYVDLDFSDMEDVSCLGPGLLVEVEDMKENTHVLIWLE